MNKTLSSLASVVVAICVSAAPNASYAGEIIATVLGQSIDSDELRSPGAALGPLIIRPLLQRFAAEQHLVVTPGEIDEFASATKMPPALSGMTSAERSEIRNMQEGMVLEWKISGALYRRYGGDVIFQQANPMEPIGAMRKFLEEQEQSKAFTIYKTADRDRFYAYYTRARQSVLPASAVNYDTPWWRK